MRKLSGLFFVTLIMVAFQNCGRVAFETVDSGLSKTGFVEGPAIADVLVDKDDLVEKEEVKKEEVKKEEGKKEEVVVAKEEGKKEDCNKDGDKKDSKDFIAKDEDKKGYADNLTDEEVDLIACENGDKGSKKVLICHYPSGNPAAKHTICINRSALNAHDHHGQGGAAKDTLGACAGLDIASADND